MSSTKAATADGSTVRDGATLHVGPFFLILALSLSIAAFLLLRGQPLSALPPLQIGMTLNAGAYLTQIQRAGFASVHRAEIEAAETLGFSKLQSVRYVILPHIMRTLFPPLSNLYILMTLGTSMAAVFGVEELTGRAFNVNSETFRSIEVFSLTAVAYIVITFVATFVLPAAGANDVTVGGVVSAGGVVLSTTSTQ